MQNANPGKKYTPNRKMPGWWQSLLEQSRLCRKQQLPVQKMQHPC